MAVPDAEPPVAPPQPPGLPSTPSQPLVRPHRWTIPAAAVVVVVVVVLSALYLTGLPPFGPRTASGPHGPVTFATARAAGDSAVHRYHGGGWGLVAAGALVTSSTLSVPTAFGGSSYFNCSIQAIGQTTSITVPGFRGNVSSGSSTIWELIYWGNGTAVVVSVVNGSAQLTAQSAGSAACATAFGYLGSVPSTVLDSSVVVQTADSAGGAAFRTNHPGANVTMALVGGFSVLGFTGPSIWRVDYSLCSVAGGSRSVLPEFKATINAATGTVISSGLGSVNCSLTSSVASLIGLRAMSVPTGPLSGSEVTLAAASRLPRS